MAIVPNLVRGEDGELRAVPETREGYRESSLTSRNYDWGEQIARFPKSTPEEVEKWANQWFKEEALRARLETRCGKHLRKIRRNGQFFRDLVENALQGETSFTEQEVRGAGLIFLSLIAHYRWEDLHAIATATKSAINSTNLDVGGSADSTVVTLNAFLDLSRAGKLPTKQALKTRVRRTLKTVSDATFSKIFGRVGLIGLPEATRGRKANPKKRTAR